MLSRRTSYFLSMMRCILSLRFDCHTCTPIRHWFCRLHFVYNFPLKRILIKLKIRQAERRVPMAESILQNDTHAHSEIVRAHALPRVWWFCRSLIRFFAIVDFWPSEFPHQLLCAEKLCVTEGRVFEYRVYSECMLPWYTSSPCDSLHDILS